MRFMRLSLLSALAFATMHLQCVAWVPSPLPRRAGHLHHQSQCQQQLQQSNVHGHPQPDSSVVAADAPSTKVATAIASVVTSATSILLSPQIATAATDYANYYQKSYTTSLERSAGSPLEIFLFGGLVYFLLKLSKKMEERDRVLTKPSEPPQPMALPPLAPPPQPFVANIPANEYDYDYAQQLQSVPATSAATEPAPPAPIPVSAPVPAPVQLSAPTPVNSSYSYEDAMAAAVPTEPALATQTTDAADFPQTQSPEPAPATETAPNGDINGSPNDYMADFIAACKAGSE